MSRPLRVEYSGALYHVMNRGNRRESVFRKVSDYQLFLERLGRFAAEFDVEVLCYCLMPNHFHLFLRTRQANLGRFMQSLLTSFTVTMNRRGKTSGHLFQGRFKSQLVDEDGYFGILSRYIHLNPVRVKSAISLPVEERRRLLAEYRWSSFPALIGLAEAQKWLQTDNVLKWFGKRPGEQMKAYRQYVEDGLLREIKDPSAQMKIRSILGSDTFTDWVKREFLLKSKIRDRREQPELARQNGGIDVRRIVAAVAASYEIDPPSLLKKGCRKRQAKSLAIFLSSRHGRGIMSLTRMAAMFNLSLSGLTSVRDRMELRLAKSSATSELGKHYAKVIEAMFSSQVKLNTEV